MKMLKELLEYQKKYPVNVFNIIKSYNIELLYNTINDDNTSGYIEKDDDNNFKIAINKNHSEVRQRFTAAHELGHYLLHGNILIDKGKISDNRLYRAEPDSMVTQKHETQANTFAAELLMPENLIVKATEDFLKDKNTEEFKELLAKLEALIKLGRPSDPYTYESDKSSKYSEFYECSHGAEGVREKISNMLEVSDVAMEIRLRILKSKHKRKANGDTDVIF